MRRDSAGGEVRRQPVEVISERNALERGATAGDSSGNRVAPWTGDDVNRNYDGWRVPRNYAPYRFHQ